MGLLGRHTPRGPLAFRFMSSHSSAIPAEGKPLFPSGSQKSLMADSDRVCILELISVARGWTTPLAGDCSWIHTGVEVESGPQDLHRLRGGGYLSTQE